MATRLGQLLIESRKDLRYEPTAKRIRAIAAGRTVVDTTRAVLVWKARQVVPCYAVPADEVRGELGPSDAEPVDDTDLAGYVLLRFGAFERWLEEEEEISGHPRDPFHRVDARRSSRHVRIELGGVPLAESSRPTMVFETSLPTRVYLPREDVDMARLRPSSKRTICAYKGDASYFSVVTPERAVEDVVWSYESPLPDALPLAGLVSFYDDQVDVWVDGRAVS